MNFMAKTVAAVATGNAAGGIGVIRISGENALVTAEALVPNYLKLAQAEKEKLEKEGKL